MFQIGRKAATVAVTAVLGTGMLGGAALAAFAPAAGTTLSLDATAGTATQSESGRSELATILDALVAKGVITQAQEDAIQGALKDARADREAVHRRIFGGLLQESATYLGIAPKDLRAKLAGTSLGALADATSGKSRAGLIADLVAFAGTAVDKAVADGKLTQAQADTLKASLPGRMTKLVDRVWPAARPKLELRSYLAGAMQDARDYLGLSQKDIAAQLRSGKSLADIAAAAGKDRQGLIDAIMQDANARIDKAVQDGKITVAQAAEVKSKVRDLVTKMVDRKGTVHRKPAPAAAP